MAGRRKLIVVANRGPVTFSRETDGAHSARRGGGGLVTALRSLLDEPGRDVGGERDVGRGSRRAAGGRRRSRSRRRPATARPYRLRLVSHDPQAYDLYYNVVSNPVLWFAQHYLWGLAESPNIDHGLHLAWSEGYQAVNRAFADAVVEELGGEPEAAVFFHDYHLYVAPGLVRERVPDATMSHFVHIPWPQPDYWRVLPESIRRAIHEGLARERPRRLPHGALVPELPALLRGHPRREERLQRRPGHLRRAARCSCTRGPSRSTPAEFAGLAESERVLAEEAKIEARRRSS